MEEKKESGVLFEREKRHNYDSIIKNKDINTQINKRRGTRPCRKKLEKGYTDWVSNNRLL